jgi:hypothetical protein
MPKTMRTKTLFITLTVVAAVALAAVPLAGANPASDPVPQVVAAPVPIQILTGKKLFVSNGISTATPDVPNLPYNEFYADMKAWGRYELVATPADADLVFEVALRKRTSQRIFRTAAGDTGS